MTEKLTQNRSAEAAVLGSMLLDRECIETVRGIIKDQSYFGITEHRVLYSFLIELSERADCWDIVLIRDRLKLAGKLEAVGGVEYLGKLMEHVPTSASAAYYCKLILETHKRRLMLEQADALRRAASEPGDVTAALQSFQQDIGELAGSTTDTPADGAAAVWGLIDDSIHNRRQILRMPWSIMGRLSNALQPGTCTILCGGIGASKSFAKSELLQFVIESGHAAAAFELEDSQAFHLTRMLAQKTELPGLTDPDWIKANPCISQAAFAENESWLTDIGRAVDADGGGQVTYGRLTNWALQKARQGCKLLVVDPVTAVEHTRRDIWTEDNDFLQKIKRIAVDHGVAVLLVTHSSKTNITPGLESLAGGAAFSRFAQTVFWLEAHENRLSNVRFDCGTIETAHNRTIHLLKTRLGKGQSLRIAATFTDKLKLIEHGVIIKKQKDRSYG
jgi:hypothetical protein